MVSASILDASLPAIKTSVEVCDGECNALLDASLPAIKTSVEICDDECKHTQPHMHSVLFAGCVKFSLNGTS